MKSGVYEIRNKLNGKFYIGSSVNLNRRKNRHLLELRENRHFNNPLQNAYNKDGFDNFEFIILEYVEDVNQLLKIESKYIKELNPLDKNIGYNLCSEARSALGIKRSDEWKRKMSVVHKNKIISDESRKKMSESHKLMSDETRKRISDSKKGVKMHENTIVALRKAVIGNKWNVGKKLSAETKFKIGINTRGVPHPKIQCPHCEKVGGYSAMIQWHFDNCKYKILCNAAV